jgi:hypothetical protein
MTDLPIIMLSIIIMAFVAMTILMPIAVFCIWHHVAKTSATLERMERLMRGAN